MHDMWDCKDGLARGANVRVACTGTADVPTHRPFAVDLPIPPVHGFSSADPACLVKGWVILTHCTHIGIKCTADNVELDFVVDVGVEALEPVVEVLACKLEEAV